MKIHRERSEPMKVIFMGTPDFSVPILQRLIADGYELVAVVTQPDRRKGRKKQWTAPPVKIVAEQHGIPVIQPKKIKHEASLQQVLSYEPDVIVTAAFGQMLPKQLLDAPSYGCINVHASLLPAYRGGAPIHRAIIDGRNETGVTIMYMAEKMDAGDIIAQKATAIHEDDTVGTLHDTLSEQGAELLSDTLAHITEGLPAVAQQHEAATFAPNITRADERVDWQLSGEAIYNQIRGLNPFPGAYSTKDDKVLKIWAAEKVTTDKPTADPGEITAVDKQSFTVKSGNDTDLRLMVIQPAGKSKMTAEQFLQGSALHVGEQLI